jgi:hypothetical protein
MTDVAERARFVSEATVLIGKIRYVRGGREGKK